MKSSGALIKIAYLLMLFSIAFFLFTISHNFVAVEGTSMQPTLMDGDTALSSKVTDITPGKVYLIIEPTQEYFAVKRLVGVPGDTLEFVDGALYRNGVLVDKPHGDSFDNMKVTLGVDEYFFVGDNRRDSYDSRYWSEYVHLDDIVGEITYIMSPMSRRGKVVDWSNEV